MLRTSACGNDGFAVPRRAFLAGIVFLQLRRKTADCAYPLMTRTWGSVKDSHPSSHAQTAVPGLGGLVFIQHACRQESARRPRPPSASPR